MKSFTIRILLFLLPIFAALLYIEVKLSGIENSYNKKRQLLGRQLNHIEILVTGSSQNLYGIDPGCFSVPGFNLANVSQSFYYDKRIVLKYIDSIPNLKMVIIPAGYFSFMGQLYGTKEEWRDFFYDRFWDIKYKDLPTFDLRRYSLISLYSLPLTVQYIDSAFRVNLAPRYNEYGYVACDTSGHLAAINDSSGKERVAYHNSCMNRKDQQYIIQDLQDFVDVLQSKKIKVVFVMNPVFHTYSDNCSPAILSMNDSLLKHICLRSHCTYYNYMMDKRFVIDDFFDNDHLGFTGAKKYSKIIDSEIIVPNIK